MSMKCEPYFKFWRITALSNYGDVNVRFDAIRLYGREGGPNLLAAPVDVTYTGGFGDGDLVAPIVNLPSVAYELEYPVIPRQIDLDYTPVTGYELGLFYLDAGGLASAVCIAWSPALSLFVLFDSSGNVSRSATGLDWSAGALVSGHDYRDVCWSPELGIFVAVGQIRVATSSDGITWSNVASLPMTMVAVAWSPELGIFVAVPSSSGSTHTGYSSNGTTWTGVTSPPGGQGPWWGVAWSPALGMFAAVGSAASNKIKTSVNGSTWVLRGGTNNYRAITWCPELAIFVAIGIQHVATSSDGVTWTETIVASFTGSDLWRTVTWCAELGVFIATGSAGAYRLATSTDGLVWTLVSGFSANGPIGAAYSPQLHRYVAPDNSGVPQAIINDPTTLSVGSTDAPRNVLIEVSNNKREWYELETFEDLQWPL